MNFTKWILVIAGALLSTHSVYAEFADVEDSRASQNASLSVKACQDVSALYAGHKEDGVAEAQLVSCSRDRLACESASSTITRMQRPLPPELAGCSSSSEKVATAASAAAGDQAACRYWCATTCLRPPQGLEFDTYGVCMSHKKRCGC